MTEDQTSISCETEELNCERTDFADGRVEVIAKWRKWKARHVPRLSFTRQNFTAEVELCYLPDGRFVGGEIRIRDEDGVVERKSIPIGAAEDRSPS